MTGHTLWWLILLFLIQRFSCEIHPENPFKLQDSNLTATEGSCIEIKCQIIKSVSDGPASWFWMKDAVWINGSFSATTIFSSSESKHPVNAHFAKRVEYVGSPSRSWKNPPSSLCSILIRDLNKTDTGNYSFRYVGTSSSDIWTTQPFTNLTVTENPCLLTFEEPKNVTENGNVTLTCSTLSSCTSGLKIEGPSASLSQSKPENPKKTTLSFKVTWEDDGRMFSCQTENNTDPCLIRNISLTVGYAPKDMSANISSNIVKEGESVSFTCSAKGQPEPTFTWTKDGRDLDSKANWMISSITASQNGSYICKAVNKYGSKELVVTVGVIYAPDVDIEISQKSGRSPKTIIQGDKVIFTCSVKRSNPPPDSFTWQKDKTHIDSKQRIVVENIQPEDRGKYTCSAKNTVGSGSKTLQLTVQYKPRKTNISIHQTRVKINTTAKFTCLTDAYPDPSSYSWFHYKQTDIPQKKMLMVVIATLHLEKVKRANEGCYICNASNSIDTGDTSKPVCIDVLFPPNHTNLYMTELVTEGDPVEVNCTAESFPLPTFTLARYSKSNSQTPEWSLILDNSYKFKANSTDAGFYTCKASNSEGNQWSSKKQLVVNYSPREVKITGHPGLIVKENESLTLDCSANSYPSVSSFTWMKMIDGMMESTISTGTPFIVDSASVSDSGKYRCTATNKIGTGKSVQVEVKVKHGPKFTKIEKEKEEQHDELTGVKLRCISQCYPEVTQYSWYQRINKKENKNVANGTDIFVRSDQPGEYYCVAKNEIGERSSEPIKLFDDTVMKIVEVFSLCLIFLIVCILIFLYRRRRNNLIQQRTTNVWSWSSFLGSWNGVSRSSGNQSGLAEPFRSRDDLLLNHPCQPNAQRPQRHPDSTTASNVNTVYSAVNLPKSKQAASAQNPIKGHGGNMGNDSLNYASVFFENRKKDSEEDAEYSVVSKPKKSKVTEQEVQEDYENIGEELPPKPPYTYNFDSETDTSEDEVEVNYAHVNIKPKSGHQRDSSSSSSEDETQYSQVKI
ncbi:B-cell receptor CD22 [Haplochromis burtoni]|uniref:B-cell receptor CD22 n=1 Tax=Haplochromis burtoni TaxID=8153 RepID=UPI0003BC995E|nr:B-cell receptor CD22 [Haplochromis burtoni]XP_042071531.1 B-cell receptor CD22 [Haplochromis burtoni]XP_042071532.1 B-cell receptor CD22 [Haplochromis burtoni]XP_042071533.1 B-cell receptor CD22 [Haplochromis burtoni]